MNTRKTTALLFSTLALAALILGACGPVASPTPDTVTVKETVVVNQNTVVTATPEPAGPVTISFWHTYNADVETPFLEQTLIPAFEAAHPNIKVQSVVYPYDQYRRSLLTAISGGTAPDVARLDIIWVPEFADQGALAELDTVMSDFNTYEDAVFPGPLSTNYYNGHYYGLPLDTNTRVLVYNKAMFEAAGIAEAPQTIDEFVAVCEKIKTLGSDKYCFADGGTYAWAVNPWIWSFGGDVTDADISQASGALNGPDTVAAYEFLKDGVDKGYITGMNGGGVDAWGGFAQGNIAMLLEGPWFPPIFNQQHPDVPYGMALMPAGKGGSISVVGGEDIVMFQQSQNKEAAAEFIRYMLSEEVQLKWSEAGQMPVLKSSLDADVIKQHAFFGPFLEQLNTSKARTPHPAWTRMEEIYTNDGMAILTGEMTAQDALDDAASKIDPLLGQ